MDLKTSQERTQRWASEIYRLVHSANDHGRQPSIAQLAHAHRNLSRWMLEKGYLVNVSPLFDKQALQVPEPWPVERVLEDKDWAQLAPDNMRFILDGEVLTKRQWWKRINFGLHYGMGQAKLNSMMDQVMKADKITSLTEIKAETLDDVSVEIINMNTLGKGMP